MLWLVVLVGGLWLIRAPSPFPLGDAPRRVRRGGRARRTVRDLARPAAILLGVALVVTAHWAVGVAGGVAAWYLLPPLLQRLTTDAEARRTAQLTAQAPLVTELLATCVQSGATLPDALGAVAEAVPSPAAETLGRAARAAELGADAESIAALLGDSGLPAWAALAAAVSRSGRTGGSLARLLVGEAERARVAWLSAAQVRARSVSVRTVIPLALCFLPAFIVLGVVPIIAGFLTGLL